MTDWQQFDDVMDRVRLLLAGPDETISISASELRTITDVVVWAGPASDDDEVNVIGWLWGVLRGRNPAEARRIVDYVSDRLAASLDDL